MIFAKPENAELTKMAACNMHQVGWEGGGYRY